MKTVTIHQAKTNLSRLIEKACAGEEIIIARGSEPVARLVALADKNGRRQPGSLKGKLPVGTEFFEPVPASDLGAWSGALSTRLLLDPHAWQVCVCHDPRLP